MLENNKVSAEEELAYKSSEQYIEQVARNDLNLIKPGEKVFVAPEVMSAVTDKTAEVKDELEKSNIQLWADLFF